MKRGEFFQKNVSRPSNPPDELAQNVSKKNPRRTNYSSIFPSKVRIWPFLNYLHDLNSFFWAQRIKSELFFGRTVNVFSVDYLETSLFLWCELDLLSLAIMPGDVLWDAGAQEEIIRRHHMEQ